MSANLTAEAGPVLAHDPTTADRRIAWSSLGAIGLGYMLVSWGLGPISSILPTIAADLAILDPAAGSGDALVAAGWVMNAYFLLIVSSVLLAGRLGDLLGHRRVFALGIALFGLGALAAAVSPRLVALVAARGRLRAATARVTCPRLARGAELLAGR